MEYEINGKNLVFHLPEELDHHSSRTLRQDSEILLAQYEIRRMVFDFSRVSFMDSSGIGVLLGRYKRMQELGGDISYYGAEGRVKRLLAMSGVEKLAAGYGSKAEALRK